MPKTIDEKLMQDICQFFDEHPTLFCFFADPMSDTIIAAHERRQIARRTVDPVGEIADSLNYKAGKRARGQMVMKFASMIDNIARDKADSQSLKSLLLHKKGRKIQSIIKK